MAGDDYKRFVVDENMILSYEQEISLLSSASYEQFQRRLASIRIANEDALLMEHASIGAKAAGWAGRFIFLVTLLAVLGFMFWLSARKKSDVSVNRPPQTHPVSPQLIGKTPVAIPSLQVPASAGDTWMAIASFFLTPIAPILLAIYNFSRGRKAQGKLYLIVLLVQVVIVAFRFLSRH